MFLEEQLSLDAFTMSQANLVNQIAITYFLGVHTICRVVNRTSTSLNFPMNELPLVVVQSQNGMTQAVDLGCSVFLVDEDAVIQFFNEYISMHDQALIRIPDKYVLTVVQSTGMEQMNILNDIQNHPAVEEIVNLLLVVPKDKVFQLLTHRFVGSHPESLDLFLLDTYISVNDSFVNGNNLFPDKMGNLMGKTLRVASFYLLPWVMMRQSDDGVVRYRNQSYTIDGLDGYLLIQFCLRYNCTWDLHVDQEYQYGQVFANRTGNGMLGALLNRDVDFAIGAIGGYYRIFQYFSLSSPLQWIGVSALAQKPKLVPYWKFVFLIFSKSVWSILIVTFIAVSFCLYILQSTESIHRKSISVMFLNTLRVFVLTSANLSTNRSSEVILVTCLLMFTIIIGNVYIGQIHGILAFPPYQAPIDTMLELAESGIRLVAPHIAWKYFLEGSELKRDQMILACFHVPPIEDIPKIVNGGREAMVMALLENGHLMVGDWFNARNVEQYRLIIDALYFEYEVGYATKTWPLLSQFDDWVMWVRDACLFQYIEQIEVNRYMNYWVQVSIEHSRDRPTRQLRYMSVDQISGALMILGVGYAIALVMFLLEMGAMILERRRQHNTRERPAERKGGLNL